MFQHSFTELMGSFQEAIKCLSEFACNSFFVDISMNAIRLIRFSATLVSQNTEFINQLENVDDNISNLNKILISY